MFKVFRSFSLKNKFLYPEALQYKYPWALEKLSNGIQLSFDPSPHETSALSILSDIGLQTFPQAEICLKAFKKKLGHPGFSYKISWDTTTLNIECMKSESEFLLKKLIENLLTADFAYTDKDVESYDLVNLSLNQCFDRKDELKRQKTQANDILQGKKLKISCQGFDDNALKVFETIPEGDVLPYKTLKYKPVMQIIETQSDDATTCIAYHGPSLKTEDSLLFFFLSELFNHDYPLYLDHSKQFNYLSSILSSIPGIYSYKCLYHPSYDSGLILHIFNTHPLSTTFAGSAITKSMKRLSKQLIPQEIARAKLKIFNTLINSQSQIEMCKKRNQDLRQGTLPGEYGDFLLNITEEYICRKISEWTTSKFPSVLLQGKVLSEGVIEGMFSN